MDGQHASVLGSTTGYPSVYSMEHWGTGCSTLHSGLLCVLGGTNLEVRAPGQLVERGDLSDKEDRRPTDLERNFTPRTQACSLEGKRLQAAFREELHWSAEQVTVSI